MIREFLHATSNVDAATEGKIGVIPLSNDGACRHKNKKTTESNLELALSEKYLLADGPRRVTSPS